MAHIDSSSYNCGLAKTDLYGDCINAITGGYMKAAGHHADQLPRIIPSQPPNKHELREALNAFDWRLLDDAGLSDGH